MHPVGEIVKQLLLYGIYTEIPEELTSVFKNFGKGGQNSREFLPILGRNILLDFVKLQYIC
jgi:hypothetical protein